MRRYTSILAATALATVMGIVSVPHSGSAQTLPPPVPNPYNPYPVGILPADLPTEIQRVQREIIGIFNQALGEAFVLFENPPTPTGNPPILKDTGYQAQQILGKLMNFDLNISPFRNAACSFCHMPYAGFSGPIPSVNLTMVAYPGSFHFRAGKRTAQRYTYSPRFPVFDFNQTQGTFFGGNFWDGRATGYKLQSADAEQAQGPPVDTQEMGFPDTACIAWRLSNASYRAVFELVWGASFEIAWPANTETICATPGGAARFGGSVTPIRLSPEDRTMANNVYDHWAQSISFYESTAEVSPFTSKFDAFLAGAYTLTPDEMAGYNLFKGKGNCNSCHLDGRSTTLTPSQTDTGTKADTEPLFTCFGYINLGVPLNPRDAFYYQTTPDRFGFTPNPFGFGYRDLGLGTFLRSGPGTFASPNSTWTQFVPSRDGRFQVSTARNVAMTPPQCPTTEAPGPYFQKEFFHNGYIKSLKQLVHFYNTRDVFPFNVTSGHCPIGTTEKVDCWPMPEVTNNLNKTIGNLQLTPLEEDQLVIFLQALTDGFNPLNPTVSTYTNINTYTGQCMTGGTAATQGNGFLIPTPPLPPCASAICGAALPFPPNPPIP